MLYHVVVIGGGPRGLSIVERLTAIVAERKPGWQLQVHLIDPAEPGQGAHSSRQPDHLLANTVAGQVTLFTDPSVLGAGPIKPGPSLLDWARAAGYRRVDARYIQTHDDGEEIHENDYLPRAMLGDYLTYVYDLLASSLPHNIRLTHHRRMATDLTPLEDGRCLVELAGGFHIVADCIVLATGHSENGPDVEDDFLRRQILAGQKFNPDLQFLSSANPISVLQSISSNARVYIQGMGLTAYDVVTELTVGRGGKFYVDGLGQFQYRPSGREPKMVLASRQGVPFSARAVNQKSIDGLHRPIFFTKALIDRLRQRKQDETGCTKLDYLLDLWPTLKKEMCFVYDTTRGSTLPEDLAQYEPSAESEQAISEIISPLGESQFADEAAFKKAVCLHMELDLANASGGNVHNPVKAATDVLRDLRDHVRYAIDYGGLTEESHRHFLERVVPVMYRISAGAPKERNEQLLALIKAGIAEFGPGPSPNLSYDPSQARFVLRSTRLHKPSEAYADVLIRARIDCAIYPKRQDAPLMRNLLRRGLVRPFMNGGFHPGGIDVDSSQNVIDANGRVRRNVWALGLIAEGPNFCTYVLPRTLVNSRFLQLSGRCALNLFATLDDQYQQHFAPAVRVAPQ